MSKLALKNIKNYYVYIFGTINKYFIIYLSQIIEKSSKFLF